MLDRSEHLRGVFSLRELLMTPPGQEGARLHDREPRRRAHSTPARKRSPKSIAKYNLLALPVVDEEDAPARHHHDRRRDRPGASARVEEAPAEDLPLRRPRWRGLAACPEAGALAGRVGRTRLLVILATARAGLHRRQRRQRRRRHHHVVGDRLALRLQHDLAARA
ncbi:MAG: hypothetical protein MZV63_34320 [Marinilabiliales bacterium]|nr:hypothetical protein [Marinilabiliales bacterium]